MILTNSKKGQILINESDIMYCVADGSYTVLQISGKGKVVVSKSLMQIEKQLTNPEFLRIHRSHIVNLNRADFFINHTTNVLRMEDGEELKLSKDKKKDFLSRYIKL